LPDALLQLRRDSRRPRGQLLPRIGETLRRSRRTEDGDGVAGLGEAFARSVFALRTRAPCLLGAAVGLACGALGRTSLLENGGELERPEALRPNLFHARRRCRRLERLRELSFARGDDGDGRGVLRLRLVLVDVRLLRGHGILVRGPRRLRLTELLPHRIGRGPAAFDLGEARLDDRGFGLSRQPRHGFVVAGAYRGEHLFDAAVRLVRMAAFLAPCVDVNLQCGELALHAADVRRQLGHHLLAHRARVTFVQVCCQRCRGCEPFRLGEENFRSALRLLRCRLRLRRLALPRDGSLQLGSELGQLIEPRECGGERGALPQPTQRFLGSVGRCLARPDGIHQPTELRADGVGAFCGREQHRYVPLQRVPRFGETCRRGVATAMQLQQPIAFRNARVLSGSCLRLGDCHSGRVPFHRCRGKQGDGCLQLRIELGDTFGHDDGTDECQRGLRAGQLAARVGRPLRQLDECRHGNPYFVLRRADPLHARPQGLQPLRCDVRPGFDHRALQHVGVLIARLGELSSHDTDTAVHAEAEQLTQQRTARAGLVVEEVGEPALGKDDRLVELREVEAEQLLDLLGHRLGVGCKHLTAGLQACLFGAAATGLGPAHDAHRRVRRAVQLELEPHPSLVAQLVDHRCDELLVVSRNCAVQRERDGIDDAALASTGGPDECSQLDIREVDLGAIGERRETLHLEAQRSHADTSTSRSSSVANNESSRGSSICSDAK
jgi:hypothetical protein